MSERQDENFLQGYMRLCQGTEIPDIFSLWCGVFGVSTALGRRCYVDMGTFQVYPNLYCVLVAGSGRCRKSTAIGQIEKFLHQLDPKPNLIAQKITPEALIDALRGQAVSPEEKKINLNHEGYVIVDELATFLNRKSYDQGLGSMLTSLYDCKDFFEYQTLSRGKETITSSCLGILGAATVDWLRKAIPEEAIGGGLTSRMAFIYVEEPPPPVPRPTFDRDKQRLFEKLLRALQRITMISGEFKLSKKAETWFDEEYKAFYYNSPFFDQSSLRGYATRRHVHLTKLAMIFCAAETGEKLIEVRHFEGAKRVLEQSEAHMQRVLALVSSSDTGEAMNELHALITAKGEISRQEIIKQFSNRFTVQETDEKINTLRASGQLTEETRGGQLYYKIRA